MSHSLFDLAGELAVVVGATGVLGGALAEGLADAGASVAVLGRDRGRGEACAGRITERGGRARFVAVDATDVRSVAAAHREVADALGAPTVLVNAAGGNNANVTATEDHPFEE